MSKVLIVVPVYNEEKIIEQNLKKLYEYAKLNLSSYDFRILVADNNSNDQTAPIVKKLTNQFSQIGYEFFEKKGKT